MRPNMRHFDKLTETEKITARASVINHETRALHKKIRTQKTEVSRDIHARVNDRHNIQRHVTALKNIKRLTTDRKYLDTFIMENLAEFNHSAEFIPYSPELY